MPSGRNNREIDNRLELVEKENRKLNSIVDSILAGNTPSEITATPYDYELNRQPECIPNTTVVQSITLLPYRVNLISFNVIPFENDISIVLNNVPIIMASDSMGNFYVPSLGVNTIQNIDLTQSYSIFISGNQPIDIEVVGCAIDPNTIEYTIRPNQMNQISYLGQAPFLIENYFSAISDRILLVSNDGSNYYVPSAGINSIDATGGMLPGKGYYLFIDGQDSISFIPPALYSDVPNLPIENTDLDSSCFNDNDNTMLHPMYGFVSPWGYGIGGEFCMDYFDYPDLWKLDANQGGNNLWGIGITQLYSVYANVDTLQPEWSVYCADVNGNENMNTILGGPNLGKSVCGLPDGESSCTGNYVCQPIPDNSCRAIMARTCMTADSEIGTDNCIEFMCDPSPPNTDVFGSDVYWISSLCPKLCSSLSKVDNNIIDYDYDNCTQRNLLEPYDITGLPITNTTAEEFLPCDCTGRRYLYPDGDGNLICAYPPELNPPDGDTDDSGGMIPVIIYGCTYPQAPNYNPDATQDDGSCRFNFTPDDESNDDTIITPDEEDDPTPVIVYGCMDFRACNYNSEANVSNPRLCEYGRTCSDGTQICPPETCPEDTDPTEIDPDNQDDTPIDLREFIQIENIIINDRNVRFNVNIIDYDNFDDRNQAVNVHWGDGMMASNYSTEYGDGPFTFQHDYENYGSFFITVELRNDGQSLPNDIVVFQVNVTEFLPDTTDIIVVRSVITRDRDVTLTYEYLDFNDDGADRDIPVKIDWGSLITNSTQTIDTPTNTPITTAYSYPNYGSYTITLQSEFNTSINTSWNIELEEPVEIPPTVEDFVRINSVTVDDLTVLLDITYIDSFYDIDEESLQRPIVIDWGDGSSLNQNVTVNTAPNALIFAKTYDTYGTYTINITASDSDQTTSVEIPLIEPIEEEIPVPIEFEGDWIQGGDFNYIANTLPPTDVLLCTVADFTTGLYPDSDCVGQVEGAGCYDSGFGFDYGECRPYPSARTIKNSIFETCESTEPITDEALLESYLENSKLRTTQYQEDGTTYQNGDFGYSNGYALPYLDSGKGYIFKTQLGVNFCLKLTQPEPNL